ncbi:MAG: CoA-binding protein [Caldilineaceae bacterium]|nr:CoA-binding protein [Caldilineaceae bacterium]
MQETEALVHKYVEEPVWAVVGASNDRAKYGNRIYLKLKQAGYRVYPVNRREQKIEGEIAYASLLDLPEPPTVVNMVVPPHEAPAVVQQAEVAGAQAIWFQPGAENAEAVQWALERGLDVVESCILVQLALRPPSFEATSSLSSDPSPRDPSPDPATSTRQ